MKRKLKIKENVLEIREKVLLYSVCHIGLMMILYCHAMHISQIMQKII